MTVNDAVAIRIKNLLKKNLMSQYRLEVNTGIQHGSMDCITKGRNKDVQLGTIMLIAKGFNMTLLEFLDDDVFRSEDLELF